jgi:hypothetical protein
MVTVVRIIFIPQKVESLVIFGRLQVTGEDVGSEIGEYFMNGFPVHTPVG